MIFIITIIFFAIFGKLLGRQIYFFVHELANNFTRQIYIEYYNYSYYDYNSMFLKYSNLILLLKETNFEMVLILIVFNLTSNSQIDEIGALYTSIYLI